MSEADRRPVIFLAFANDRDDRARYLRNLPEEARRVRERLEEAHPRKICEVVVRNNATVGELLDVFMDPRYRERVAVFHFAGHAGGYQLLMESAEGRPDLAHGAGLAEFLGHQHGLQLVFLNGCSTQPQVEGLLQAGVPAVIGTSESIDDSMAMELSARFYAAVAGGATIATAYAQAAAAVKTVKGSHTRDLYRAETADSDRWPWDLYVKEGADVVREWSLPKAAGDPLFGLPPLPEQDLPETPYRHLQWFREEDAQLFFGRGREIRAFYELVTSPAAAPILLFYGQSGVGKSSMLAAGLLPRLAASHQVRYIRRQDIGLSETLATALQTAGPDASAADRWHALESEAGQPLVVILDQVEEVYTRPRPDDPDELGLFLGVLSEIFAHRARRPRGKLVLGFRKEWLADLEERLLEKQLPRSRSYLERLDRDGIVEIVTGPSRSERLRTHFRLTVEQGLGELIADGLLEDRDAPVAPTLEVLLTKMWKQATARDGDAPAFTTHIYQELRRKGLLLDDFLSEQLSALRDWNVQVVDSGLALDLLAFHTTPLGTAESRTGAEVDAAYPHQGSTLPGLLQRNKDLYLLVEHTTTTEKKEERAAGTRLAHDTLAPLIRRRFKDSDAPGQRARRILDTRGDEWWEGKAGNPLDQADLATVERGESGMPTWTPDERRLVKASRARRRNRRWIVRGLALAGIAAAGLIVGLYLSTRANEKQAVSRALAATAKSEPPLDLALLLGLEAMRAYPTFEARDALLGTLLRPVPGLRQHIIKEAAFSIALAAEGTALAIGSDEGVRVWDLMKRPLTGELLAGHPSSIMAFSPDLNMLASSGTDGLRLWDLRKRPLTGDSLGNADGLIGLAFSPDGNTLASGGTDGVFRVWDVKSRRLMDSVDRNVDFVFGVAFSPDSRTLAFVNGDGLGLWGVKREGLTIEPLTRGVELLKGGVEVLTVAFSPDGNTLASGDTDGVLRLWDVKRLQPIGELVAVGGGTSSLAFSPDGNTLASGGPDGLRLWDLKKLALIGDRLPGDGSSMAFSRDGAILAYGSGDGLRLWDVKRLQPIGEPLAVGGGTSSVAFGPDGSTLLSTSDDGLRLWDLAERPLIGELLVGNAGIIFDLAFSPDGKMLASGNEAGLRLWDLTKRPLIGELVGDTGTVSNVAFSTDGNFLTSNNNAELRFWHLKQSPLIGERLAGVQDIWSIAFIPDGNTVAVGGGDETRLWDLKRRQPIGTPLAGQNRVSMLAFSPDGNTLASGSPDGLRLWDLRRRPPSHDALPVRSMPSSVDFSPHGNMIASGGSDGLRLWDLTRRPFIGERLAGVRIVSSVAFSPDGTTLAVVGAPTSNTDSTNIGLWDVKSRRQIGEPLATHIGSGSTTAFSPDGATLAFSTHEGIRLWEVSNAAWAGRACALAGRNLTTEEWIRNFPGQAYKCTCDSLPPAAGVKACPGR